MKAFNKYFSTYAEKEIQFVDLLPFDFKEFDYAVTVPLCDELEDFPRLVSSLEKAAVFSSKSILLIALVNNRLNSSQEVKKNNLELLKIWKEKLKKEGDSFQNKNFFGLKRESVSFLFLDCASEGQCFQEKEGVGLARKIACDIASYLSYKGSVKKDPIFSTDADAEVPCDFFCLQEVKIKNFFMVSPFSHRIEEGASDSKKEAIKRYECYLNSYVEGLLFACSPYAFHTIGSCIAFSLEAYVLVRGFPKSRLAGEDFYFLSKVAKVAVRVEALFSPIILSSRESSRVPFGTGQALKKILAEEKDIYKPYEKEFFYPLKAYLELARNIFSGKQDSCILEENKFFVFFNDHGYLDLLLEISKENLSEERKLKKFHDIFDAFNTLKFIQKTKEIFSF